MRKFLRFAPALALAGLALPALAQQPLVGIVVDDCTTFSPVNTELAELYVFKVPTAGDCTDMGFDLRNTGGLDTGGANATGGGYNMDPNFRGGQIASDVQFVILTYPPNAQGAGRIVIDSNNLAIGQSLGAAARQVVGNSIPSSYAAAGLAGIDLTLAGTSAPYGAKLRGPASAVTANFPQMAGLGASLMGIELAFSPVVEVNAVDWTGAGCTVAGDLPNAATTSPSGNDGMIIGYNVYRLVGTAAARPDATAFYNASINNDQTDGWQYFIPMTSTFNLSLADSNPGSPSPPAPGDSAPNDLGGLQNPDGVFGTGDEVMIFQDSSSNRGVARGTGSAPVSGTSYWYAFQPVICGSVSDFVSQKFGPAPGVLNGNHTLDRSTLAAGADSVDLDLNGSVDFFSPQADAGKPGLGLTYNHLPLLSAAVFADGTRALPATGNVTLSGTMAGSNVNLTFQSGLEIGTVQGFNVYRGLGDSRVRVNSQLILAQGTESSVYTLVDDAVQARRLSKGGSVQYTVEIVYQDGHTSSVGPFAVTMERAAATRRQR